MISFRVAIRSDALVFCLWSAAWSVSLMAADPPADARKENYDQWRLALANRFLLNLVQDREKGRGIRPVFAFLGREEGKELN